MVPSVSHSVRPAMFGPLGLGGEPYLMSPAVIHFQVVMATGRDGSSTAQISTLPFFRPSLDLRISSSYQQHVHVSQTWRLEAGTDGPEDLHSLALALSRTSPCDWHSSQRFSNNNGPTAPMRSKSAAMFGIIITSGSVRSVAALTNELYLVCLFPSLFSFFFRSK